MLFLSLLFLSLKVYLFQKSKLQRKYGRREREKEKPFIHRWFCLQIGTMALADPSQELHLGHLAVPVSAGPKPLGILWCFSRGQGGKCNSWDLNWLLCVLALSRALSATPLLCRNSSYSFVVLICRQNRENQDNMEMFIVILKLFYHMIIKLSYSTNCTFLL